MRYTNNYNNNNLNIQTNCPDSCFHKDKSFNLCKKKDNILNSLNEVEYFLKNLKKLSKGIKLYKIIK